MAHKILLIDDDPLVNKTVRLLLAKQGYEVDTSVNVVEALTHVATKDYDLVISDIRMPGENGIIAIQKIKEIYATRKHLCGYIFISGFAEEDTPEHAIQLGVDKFIDKPFDVSEILKTISEELQLVDDQRNVVVDRASVPSIIVRKPISNDRRAVITGIGVVAPNGIGKDAYWQGLTTGKNCVDKISFFDCDDYPSKVAAEIRGFDPESFGIRRNEIKRMSRSSHLAVVATKLALADAHLDLGQNVLDKTAVVIGSAVSGLEYVEYDFRALERGGAQKDATVSWYCGLRRRYFK